MGESDARVEDPFPFIVGVGRSGTTLLRAILDTRPDMAVAGQSHFIPEMLKNRRRFDEAAEGGWGEVACRRS